MVYALQQLKLLGRLVPGTVTDTKSIRGSSPLPRASSEMMMSKSPRKKRAPASHRISVSDILNKLKYCGWYWGEVSQSDAENILHLTKDGSFFLRDSNDACHLFTISLKAQGMVISVRITFSKGLFKLDAVTQDLPSFFSVVDLVEYYISDSNKDFFVQVKGHEVRVRLRHPVIKEVLPLQHLCRAEIVRNWKTPEELESLPLPAHLKRYLLDFSHSPPLHFDGTLPS